MIHAELRSTCQRAAGRPILNTGAATAIIPTRDEMSTLQEIKTAIAHLNAHDKALLAVELFAMNAEPDEVELEAALERGLKDVEAGRVRPIEEARGMIPRWTSKS
jgi:predicted transcriptional regulator